MRWALPLVLIGYWRKIRRHRWGTSGGSAQSQREGSPRRIVAKRMDPSSPHLIEMQRAGKIVSARNAPRMPTMMLPRRPKP